MIARKVERPPWDAVCERFRARLRSLVIRLGVSRLVAFALVGLAAAMFLDWRFDFGTPVRLLILLAYLGTLVGGVTWGVRRHLRHRWNDAEVLRYLDSLDPQGEDALLVLHELHHGDGVEEVKTERGRELLTTALQELDPALAAVQPDKAVEERHVRRWQVTAAGAVLASVVLTVVLSAHVGTGLMRFFNPFSSVRWPHKTTITVEAPESWFVAQGQPFTIRATVTGLEVPSEVLLVSRPRTGRQRVELPLRVQPRPEGLPGGEVSHTFPAVNDSIDFFLTGGDDETDWFQIQVIPAPELVKIEGTYRYPRYAGLVNRIIRGGDLRGLEGTQVAVAFTASTDLAEVEFELALQGDTPVVRKLPLDTPRTFRADLTLSKSGSYRVRLKDQKGLRELRPEVYDINVQPDEPPLVDILEPQGDLIATPRASVRVAIEATDDFGLAEVQFLTALGTGEAHVLTDRITGPIPQTGLRSAHAFTWDLSKVEAKVPARVTYYVRARDVNPTGLGVGESRRHQIEIVKPSAFHLHLFEQAKSILTEAHLAYVNQKRSYELRAAFADRGTGQLTDPVWTELMEAQTASNRAALRIKDLMQDLAREIGRNRMAKETATGRLNVIGALVDQVNRVHHPQAMSTLRSAAPRTEAEAATDQLRTRRTDALKAAHDDQKLAALILYRVLRKLYDWRDLQNAYIKTTLLLERQVEVTDLTEAIAPRYIGKEKEDLTDKELEELDTVAQQQKAIFESEVSLEQELSAIMLLAMQRNRLWILVPIRTAFAGLRDRQVQENLKDAYLQIADNKPFMITKKQQETVTAMQQVQKGLEVAGETVEPDPPINIDDPLPEPDPEVDKRPTGDEEAEPDPDVIRDIAALVGDRMKAVILSAGDQLSLSVQALVDLQEAVLKRTTYLEHNRSEAEMPRFVRLKLGILNERQSAALAHAAATRQVAAEIAMPEPGAILAGVHAEMQAVESLLKAGDTSLGNQAIQRDLIHSLRDLSGFLNRQNEMNARAEDHRKTGHKDAFQRNYVVRDQDLDLAVKVGRACDYGSLLQGDVFRKAHRFMTAPDTVPQRVLDVEKTSRQTAATRQKMVVDLLTQVEKDFQGFTKEVAERLDVEVQLSTVASLVPADALARVASGRFDEAFLGQLSEASSKLEDAARRLVFLIDEREAPPLPREALTTQEAAEDAVVLTPEEWAAQIRPDALAEAIKASPYVPEHLRERMLESLKFGLDPKYRSALGAYYRAVAGQPKKEEGVHSP